MSRRLPIAFAANLQTKAQFYVPEDSGFWQTCKGHASTDSLLSSVPAGSSFLLLSKVLPSAIPEELKAMLEKSLKHSQRSFLSPLRTSLELFLFSL
jgi:hypothetical protein